jgi:hypothetical protein
MSKKGVATGALNSRKQEARNHMANFYERMADGLKTSYSGIIE